MGFVRVLNLEAVYCRCRRISTESLVSSCVTIKLLTNIAPHLSKKMFFFSKSPPTSYLTLTKTFKNTKLRLSHTIIFIFPHLHHPSTALPRVPLATFGWPSGSIRRGFSTGPLGQGIFASQRLEVFPTSTMTVVEMQTGLLVFWRCVSSVCLNYPNYPNYWEYSTRFPPLFTVPPTRPLSAPNQMSLPRWPPGVHERQP